MVCQMDKYFQYKLRQMKTKWNWSYLYFYLLHLLFAFYFAPHSFFPFCHCRFCRGKCGCGCDDSNIGLEETKHKVFHRPVTGNDIEFAFNADTFETIKHIPSLFCVNTTTLPLNLKPISGKREAVNHTPPHHRGNIRHDIHHNNGYLCKMIFKFNIPRQNV